MRKIKLLIKHILEVTKLPYYTNVSQSSHISRDVKVYNPNNLYVGENSVISQGSTIMNTRAKFIMKKNSGAAFGLSVITGNHLSIPGMFLIDVTDEIKDKMDPDHQEDQDIVVEEDVWLGANVTLLKGVHIGRGSIVGAGSVVRNSVPPYSVVTGNPAKIVGFKFTPGIILEHEENLYSEEERLPFELLESNYKKYFVSRINEIREYLR